MDEGAPDLDGSVTMPALCGVAEHDLEYPKILAVMAEKNVAHYAFSQVCGCPDLAYIVAIEKSGPRTRLMSTLDVIAFHYSAIPWPEESMWYGDRQFFEAKRAPSYPALLAYFSHFVLPQPERKRRWRLPWR